MREQLIEGRRIIGRREGLRSRGKGRNMLISRQEENLPPKSNMRRRARPQREIRVSIRGFRNLLERGSWTKGGRSWRV